jgi:hypothetical protein
MIINAASFIANASQANDWEEGTVEVTLRRETRRVRAIRDSGLVTAFGMTGRYRTGTKAWPATARLMRDHHTGEIYEIVYFGRDHRSLGHFEKLNALSFA